jgi:hypothetical protein
MDLVLFRGPDRRETVDLVEEDDGGLGVAGFFEEKTKLAFSFSYPFGKAVCAFAHEEGWHGEMLLSEVMHRRRQPTDLLAISATASSKCTSQKGLSRSRRTMKQHSARWCHVKSLEYLGVQQREEGHLLKRMDVCSQH